MHDTTTQHRPTRTVRRRWLAVVGCLFLIAGCGSDGSSQNAETPEVRDMRLVFDGDSCVYEGGDTLSAGPVSLEFDNQSDSVSAMNLVWHTGDETIADMVAYIDDEPSSKHAPTWSRDVRDVWRPVFPGDSYLWEGDLEPAIHSMVCAKVSPLGVYFGAGLTVTE